MLFCVGCHSGVSSQSPKDWATGRDALQSIMTAANQWSPDADAIRLFSGTCRKAPIEGVCGNGGPLSFLSLKRKVVLFIGVEGLLPKATFRIMNCHTKNRVFSSQRSRPTAMQPFALRNTLEDHCWKRIRTRKFDTR